MFADIVCVIFACVSANHLGLISAIEEVLNKPLPILNCSKCLTYWSVFITTAGTTGIAEALALSFLSAYAAIWLELGMAYVDLQYNKHYGKIIENHNNDTAASESDEDDSAGSVS